MKLNQMPYHNWGWGTLHDVYHEHAILGVFNTKRKYPFNS